MTRSLRVFVRHTKQSLVGRKISQQGIKKLSIIFLFLYYYTQKMRGTPLIFLIKSCNLETILPFLIPNPVLDFLNFYIFFLNTIPVIFPKRLLSILNSIITIKGNSDNIVHFIQEKLQIFRIILDLNMLSAERLNTWLIFRSQIGIINLYKLLSINYKSIAI